MIVMFRYLKYSALFMGLMPVFGMHAKDNPSLPLT